jgi:hypothetical protein
MTLVEPFRDLHDFVESISYGVVDFSIAYIPDPLSCNRDEVKGVMTQFEMMDSENRNQKRGDDAP